METMQLRNIEDLERLMSLKEREVSEFVSTMAKEVAQKEWEMLEFNLFISSFGKEKLDSSTKLVEQLRQKIDSRNISLSRYEEMAERF